ncbi:MULTISPECIES: apolipoprotein N-acyltransferase [unclassified Sphingomonas]|uniref:apolipoprotein N-acyltransferase n=1 Tax=unclassified Sphingomonas TaxID=196159 RepID=UPI00082A5678|nr:MULTISPECIES: apolipoprotein N-acyltransferase [unclassified Sphingomonas]
MRPAPLIVALVAGSLSATGFAPLDLWPVLLAALAVWLALVHSAPSLRAASLRSWLFGVGHFTVGNNWIQHAFDYQDKMPPELGYVAVVLLALYLAVYPMLAGGLAWKFGRIAGTRPDAPFVLIAAAAWIVTEWLRAQMFTGYAWNPLGVAWLPAGDVARIAAMIGTYAMSGLMVLAAGALLLIARGGWRFAMLLAAIIGGAIVLNAGEPPADLRPNQPLVRVVQPNVGQEGVREPGYSERVFQALVAQSGTPGYRPRLLVWPEGAVNYYLESGYPGGWYFEAWPADTRRRIAGLLGPDDVALVGGNALLFGGDPIIDGASNSVFVVHPDATLGPRRYDKAHLVPYGEYLPMRPILSAIGLSRLVNSEIDTIPGPGPRTIAVPGFGRVGMQICYEIIFSGEVVDRAERPDMIFNPSNDAWFGAWGPPQHLAQARLRAIEEGVPVLRSTPTGISAVIDADGRLLGTVPRLTAGAVELPLPLPHPPTPFARFGNLMAALIVLLLVALAIAIRPHSR